MTSTSDWLEDSKKNFERGNYFLEQSQYQKALEEYAKSIKYLAYYIQFSNGKFSYEYFCDSQKGILIWLCNFFSNNRKLL